MTNLKYIEAQCLKIIEKVSFYNGERSELRLHFEWTNAPWSILTIFFLTWSLLSKSVTRTKNHHKYNFFCLNLKIFVAGIYKLDLVFFKLWQFLGRRRRLQQDWEAGVQTLISWRRWDHLTISWVSYFVWSRCCWQLMGAHNAFGSKVMAIWRGCFMSVDPAL